MIKPVLYIILFLNFTIQAVFSQQNLVPNGSFEEYYDCPFAPDAIGWDMLEECVGWYKPNSATSDYYNACAPHSSGVSVPSNWYGYQHAYEGAAYIGLAIFEVGVEQGSEYAQCKLNSPLKSCYVYKISYRISLSDYSPRISPTLGLRLDKIPIKNTGAFAFWGFELPAHVQSEATITDTSSWTLVQGTYIASGGEQYLTIGRFIDTTSYDNYNPPFGINNCDSCMFPSISCQYYIDSVNVIEIGPVNQSEIAVSNIFSPNLDGINEHWYPKGICFEFWTCEIMNRWGEVIYSFQNTDKGWNGVSSNQKSSTEGVYFYKVFNKEQQTTGFFHLVR